MATNVPVFCHGVLVSLDDLVFGDADDAVVVAQANEAEVSEVAIAETQCQDGSFVELWAGGFLRDTYAEFGVL